MVRTVPGSTTLAATRVVDSFTGLYFCAICSWSEGLSAVCPLDSNDAARVNKRMEGVLGANLPGKVCVLLSTDEV